MNNSNVQFAQKIFQKKTLLANVVNQSIEETVAEFDKYSFFLKKKDNKKVLVTIFKALSGPNFDQKELVSQIEHNEFGNKSTIIYCHDIEIISLTESQKDLLVNNCTEFASKEKIELNASKSVALKHGTPVSTPSFIMNNESNSSIGNFMYVNLRGGDGDFCLKFYESESVRAFYSLRGYGCKFFGLNPRAMAIIYKQFN